MSNWRTHNRISPWLLVAVLAVVGMVNYAVRTSLTAVYPLLKTDLGFTDVGLGALGSFFLWSYALASPFAGHLGDRLDRRRVVLWSLAGWSLVTAASGFVDARWQLLTMRVLLGIIESFFLPAAMALIADYHPAKTVGTGLGILILGENIGLIGGATFAGLVGDHYGWRPSLWALGVAGLAIAVPAHFLMPRKAPLTPAATLQPAAARQSFSGAMFELLKIPSFLVLAAAGALTSIGSWIFINWLPLYFRESYAMSLAGAGFFGASFINGSAAVSTVLGGLLSDRVARKGEQRRMLLQSALILAAAPTLLVFAGTRNLVVIVLGLVFNVGLRTAADVNLLPLLCDLAGREKSGMAFGLTNMVNCLAGGLGIFIAGLLKSRVSLAGIFAGTVGILICDALMLVLGYGLFLRRDLQRAAARMAPAAEPATTPSH